MHNPHARARKHREEVKGTDLVQKSLLAVAVVVSTFAGGDVVMT